MRLLHTSDWHLGRQFHGASLLEEQAAAMDRIVTLAADAEVDAVLIAGDLYDRAIPPAEAVQLFNDTLARLRQNGAAVVAIAGNHDSHVRVSIYDPLLASLRQRLRQRHGGARLQPGHHARFLGLLAETLQDLQGVPEGPVGETAGAEHRFAQPGDCTLFLHHVVLKPGDEGRNLQPHRVATCVNGREEVHPGTIVD